MIIIIIIIIVSPLSQPVAGLAGPIEVTCEGLSSPPLVLIMIHLITRDIFLSTIEKIF